MDELLSEKEQIDQFKAWWSEYGTMVIIGVVVAVGGMFGWNRYVDNKVESQMAASVLFEELANDVADGKLEEAEAVIDTMTTDFVDTPYAAQSLLAMARLYMDKNRDDDAANVLQQLLELDGSDELKPIARLRLGRIMLYQDRAQEAVDLLDVSVNSAFEPLYAEIRGDAYTVLGNVEAAGDAYRLALADDSQVVNRNILQMKLSDLPAVTEAGAAMPEPATEEPTDTADATDATTDTAADDGADE